LWPPPPPGKAQINKLVVMIDREVARFRGFSAPAAERAAYSSFVASDAGLSAQLHALLGARTAAQGPS
jgi:hypothetical protein